MFSRTLFAVFVVGAFLLSAPSLFAVGNGHLWTSFTSEGDIDYVAKGCGTYQVGEGTVTIDEVPQGAAVLQALLYWGLTQGVEDPNCFMNDNPVTGDLVGRDGKFRCFRADVTELVEGNGEYRVRDFHTYCQGFSLVVVYEHPDLPSTRIVINDGCDCNGSSGGWEWMTPTHFRGFDEPDSFYARLTYIIGEGQPQSDDRYSLWDYVFAEYDADASDGPNWDTDSYDTTGFFTWPLKHPYANVYEGSDHLGWCAAIFSLAYLSVEGGKAPEPLVFCPAVFIYPNPFNSSTNILVESAGQPGTRVEIYNVAGIRVRQLQTSPTGDGKQIVRWDATSDGGQSLPSGVYFCRSWSGGEIITKKLLYIK
jgi:hypothetical protein